MADEGTNILQAEAAFLAGVEAKLESAKGKQLQGSIWRTARHDAGDRLRALMASHRVYDRERLKELPHNRRIAMHGYKRTWWFGKRATGVAIASVLNPLEHLVAGGSGSPPPIDLPELMDHMRKIVSNPAVPHVVGVCAPSGFTPEALEASTGRSNVTLVLIEPAPGGGWKVTSADDDLPEPVLTMFDPESAGDKIGRVAKEIEDLSAELLSSGVSASSLASRLALPQELVTAALEQVARGDAELKLSRQSDDLLLFRGAASARTERTSMNVVDRIRQLFSKEGEEAEKINVLSERRAKLAVRRDRLYEDIGKLEAAEADMLKQGKETQSTVTRRRLAAQLAQRRKDISRQNTTAKMLSQQIDIISTDIHNLTLIQQGNIAQLPTTEELTENAVQAEEMLESLKVDADLVSSLETGLSEISTSDEELAILREFEQSAEREPTAEAKKEPPTRASTESAAPEARPESKPDADRGRAEPEAT